MHNYAGRQYQAVRGDRGREMMMAVIPIRSAEELAEVLDPAWPRWLELVRLARYPSWCSRRPARLFWLCCSGSGHRLVHARSAGSQQRRDAGRSRLGAAARRRQRAPARPGHRERAGTAGRLGAAGRVDVRGGRFAGKGGGCPASRARCATGDRTPWHGPR
jgi:hypothetical protein